ncbi:TPA: hypothetical protein ACPFIV_002690 [Klebsiella michiganensis]|jgi:hypothetical protein|uniref:Uncharacterized protein n=1 Tax=Klebsiella michiganensis TaxID=1134687 RepID=A0AAX3CLC0_9ENTR|nr:MULTISPECIES: hypothetical protein [Klebsiella/Raoultella group]MBZ6756499.1 hypothetical protein [Klebsiella grimontii]TWY89713.1 hypothetical protein FTO35_18215 [Klebsiella pneumoniae]UKS44597.1 hypothetical protein L3249_15850 [Klebsiella michiganensis]UWZ71762.1 hypothetical protein NP224_16050 [Klebsiella michiganensis]
MYPDYVQIEMPAQYSQADAAWIQEQLLRLPSSLRRKIALKYSEVYEIEFNAEPVSYRQENRARHEANVRLRRFVDAHGRALQGYTTQPPLAGSR